MQVLNVIFILRYQYIDSFCFQAQIQVFLITPTIILAINIPENMHVFAMGITQNK